MITGRQVHFRVTMLQPRVHELGALVPVGLEGSIPVQVDPEGPAVIRLLEAEFIAPSPGLEMAVEENLEAVVPGDFRNNLAECRVCPDVSATGVLEVLPYRCGKKKPSVVIQVQQGIHGGFHVSADTNAVLHQHGGLDHQWTVHQVAG